MLCNVHNEFFKNTQAEKYFTICFILKKIIKLTMIKKILSSIEKCCLCR